MTGQDCGCWYRCFLDERCGTFGISTVPFPLFYFAHLLIAVNAPDGVSLPVPLDLSSSTSRIVRASVLGR